MSDIYEVHASKSKFALISIAAAGACAYCLHVFFNQEPEHFLSKWQFIFKDSHQAALACLLIFVPFLLFSLWNLFSSKPVIVVNGEGIYDSRHINETIPWNGILNSGCHSIKVNGAKLHVLALELTEYQKKNTRFTLFYRVNAPFYKSGNPNVVCFHLNGLDFDFDELERAIYSQRYARPKAAGSQRRPRKLFS